MLIDQNQLKKKKIIDKVMFNVFRTAAFLAAAMIILIIVTIAQKGLSPFIFKYEVNGDYFRVNFFSFITGMSWSAPTYGVLFIIVNTLIVALGAALIAIPISILTALFIVRVCPKRFAPVFQTVIEMLASIPSIIYGVFGSIIITQIVKQIAYTFNASTYGGNGVLASIIVLSMMMIPTIASVSITAIKSVDKKVIEGSLALGATPMQTNFKVVLTSCKSGIFAGAILGIGRALGEATAVSMVAGNAISGIAILPFDITKTLTSTMLMGIKETSGLDYDIRFSVGLILMVIIILVNIILNFVKKKVGGNMDV